MAERTAGAPCIHFCCVYSDFAQSLPHGVFLESSDTLGKSGLFRSGAASREMGSAQWLAPGEKPPAGLRIGTFWRSRFPARYNPAPCQDHEMFSDFEPRIVRQDSCGVRFNCIIADRVGELWYDNPRHEPISAADALSRPLELDRRAVADWKEMGILRDHLVRPGDSIVECGCHHGLTTIMLASWTGERGFVFAFDAVPLNTAVARRNLELNR